MSKRTGRILKVVCFLLIFVLLFHTVSSILQEKYIAYDTLAETYITDQFNHLEKNSIELAVLGSSQTVRGISGMRLLENYGISAFTPSTGKQPFMCTYYYAQRLLKTQQLKAAVIDVSMLYEPIKSQWFRRVADAAPWSIDKLRLLWHYAKFRAKKDGTKEALREMWSYLFPVMQFHDRWSTLTEDDFNYEENGPIVFRGNTTRIARNVFDSFIIDGQAIDPDTHPNKYELPYFRRTLNLFRDAGVPVLLIKTPKLGWTRSKSQGVQEIADEYGLDFLDFNTQELYDAAGFDINTDIADQEHLNFSGAFKLTDYLADYLTARYDFTETVPTEQDQADLAAWHALLRKNDLMLTDDAEVFLSCALDKDCTMVVTVDAGRDIPGILKQKLAEMGFHTDLFGKESYIGLMSGGTVTFEQTKKGTLDYDTVLPNGLALRTSFIESTPGWYPAQTWLHPVQEPEPADPLAFAGTGIRIITLADRYPDIHREVVLAVENDGIVIH
ncbi:MAG: hypothetical protein IJ121_07815 [Eubacterium sp.]|nr:hypothetical protein [Eubacterium sp.]